MFPASARDIVWGRTLGFTGLRLALVLIPSGWSAWGPADAGGTYWLGRMLYIAHGVPWIDEGLGGTPICSRDTLALYEVFPARLVPVAPLRAEYLCIGHALGPALSQSEALCLRVAPSLISLRLGWPLRPVGDATTLRSAAVLSGLRVVHGERAAWAGSTLFKPGHT